MGGSLYHEEMTDPVLQVNICAAERPYNHLGADKMLAGWMGRWVLDENESSHGLTVTGPDGSNACCYTTKYGCTQVTLDKGA